MHLIVDKSMERPRLREIVIEALQTSGKAGINPQVEGRICNTQREGACLAVSGINAP